MPKKSAKGKGKKRRASTEKISINIKNIMKQHLGDRSDKREVPDFIRPLGKRPIESQAYDNRYRLLNPAITYISTPLSSMYALRDVVNAPALPQISGEPPRLRADIQPVEVNPLDIERSRPARVAVKRAPLLPPGWAASSVAEAAERRQRDAELLREITALQSEGIRLAREEQMAAPNPIIGQRLEPAQADASQLLVALQADPRARELVREPGISRVRSKPIDPTSLFELPPPLSAEELLGAEPQQGSRSMIPRASGLARYRLEGASPQGRPLRRGVAGAGDA